MLMRKNVIKVILYIVIGFILGFLANRIPTVANVTLSTEIPIFDIATLIVTTILALYVAQIIEKDIQNSQIGKQMYLDRLNQNENILADLNNYIQEDRIVLSKITNMLHRYRSRQTGIHKALKDRSRKSLFELELSSIEADTKDLKRLLTDTPIDNTDQSNITIRDGIVNYSKQRTTEIATCIARIDNTIFELKHKINSSL